MKIAVLGTGYVGLVTGTCFAELGNNVVCADIDEAKIKKLGEGISPIYEPGLEDVIKRNRKEGRLHFTTDINYAIKNSDIVFICVGTPQKDNGKSDLSYVEDAAREIGEAMNRYKLVVTKSTVPVGTTYKIKEIIKSHIKNNIEFDIASNPEFLREGEAVTDFMIPDRIIVGVENDKSKKIIESVYHGIARTTRPIFFTDIKSSELIKYASNAMLAMRISFMNEISRLCDAIGADVKQIAHGIGLDSRIGPRFLQAGAGYGGSCFSKDIKSLIVIMKECGINAELLKAVESVNEEQKRAIIGKVEQLIKNTKGRTIAIWGLSFKPKTDDMRDAPSIVIVNELQKRGANIKAFDPEAMHNAKKIFYDVTFCNDMYEAVSNADALAVVTEWNEFRNPDWDKIKKLMKQPNIVDGRNIYEPAEIKALGFNYLGVGR